VRLNEQVRVFSKSKVEMAEKDTKREHHFQRSIEEEILEVILADHLHPTEVF